jgi:phospholipase/lecithinase/hemolysin
MEGVYDTHTACVQNAGYTIPFSEQVRYFKSTKAQMVAVNGSGAVNDLLARSVFLIGIGANDIFAALSRQNIRSGSGAADQLYSSLVSYYSAAITELYRTGARNFAIINVGLVGCVPALRLLSPTGACSDDLNQLAAGFNDALESMLAGLATRLPGLRYSLADSYGLTTDTFADPQASGGCTDITDACCGCGLLNAETECTPKSRLCTNRDQFVFFDRFHPSQRAAFLTVTAFYDGPAQYTTPINFRQLAQTSS